MSNQIGSRPEPDLESLVARCAQLEQSLAAVVDRLGKLEQNAAALGEQASESGNLVGAEIRRIDKQLEVQTAILESSRTAVAQTDDLVERVVEALESIQTTVFAQPEGGAAGVN